ncbi:MAG: SGNH/GDSL hydrolase family protein [Bacteroidota bacterium]
MKAWLARGGLLMVSLGLALALGEGLVRVAAPQQLIRPNDRVWQADTLLGWQRRPNIDVLINTGDRPARFITDARGYRIAADAAAGAETAPLRVLALGDSYVEGQMVDQEETFSGRLQALLRQRDRPVDVLNAGVGGWNPGHYARYARHVLRTDTIDAAVVFLYAGNDLILPADTALTIANQAARHPLRWPASWTRREVIDAWLYPVNDALETRSHLFVFLKRRGEGLLTRYGLTPYYIPAAFRADQATSPRWAFTAAQCGRIERLFDQHGVPVLFVLLPSVIQVHQDVRDRYLRFHRVPAEAIRVDQPRDALRAAWGLHVQAPLIDVYPALLAQAQAGYRLYGQVDRHLNEAGHQAVAEAIVDTVAHLVHPPSVPIRPPADASYADYAR